jgi:DNA repair photolyase
MAVPKLPIVTLNELQKPATSMRRLARPNIVLQRGPIRYRPDMLVLEPAIGCGHHCAFCPVQGQIGRSPADPVQMFDGLADWLGAELAARSTKPRVVIIGPSTDPFQAIPELQHEVVKVVQVLAGMGIHSWLATRGAIQPDVLDALEKHRDHVRVTVSVATLDRDLQSVLEPDAASTEDRLDLIRILKKRGIPFEVALNPLLPGLTDLPDRLQVMLDRLSEIGVEQLTVGYLVLREGVKERLAEVLGPLGVAEVVLDAYADGPLLRDGQEQAQFLHKSRRQRGYALLMSIAAGLGMTVRLSELSNPDFRGPARFDAGQHVRSLQQSFREGRQFPSSNAASA